LKTLSRDIPEEMNVLNSWDKMRKIIIILIVSILINLLFGYIIFFKPRVIYKDREVIVEKPIEVIKIKTEFKFIKIPVERPSGSAEAILSQLESSMPELTLQPIYLEKDENGTIHSDEYVGGTLKLDYLKWDMITKLDVQVEEENQLNLRVGLLEGAWFTNNVPQYYSDVNLMLPIFDIVYLGVGLQSLSLTRGCKIYDQTQINYGLGYKYGDSLSGVFGMSFRM